MPPIKSSKTTKTNKSLLNAEESKIKASKKSAKPKPEGKSIKELPAKSAKRAPAAKTATPSRPLSVAKNSKSIKAPARAPAASFKAAKPEVSGRRDTRINLAAGFMRAGDKTSAANTYLDILDDRPGDRAATMAIARMAVSSRDVSLLKAAMANAVGLERPLLASCVGLLLRAGEVDALANMALANPLAGEEFVPAILRLCRTELKKPTLTRSRSTEIYRYILDLDPANAQARVGMVRLFSRDMAAANLVKGKQKADAAKSIVTDDPRNAGAVRMFAEASAEAGNYQAAYDALSKLDEQEFETARLLALFIKVSQQTRDFEGQAQDLLRMSRLRSGKDAIVRAALTGLRATSAKLPLAAVGFARAILAVSPKDEKAKSFLSAAGKKLSRQLQDAARKRQKAEAIAIWQTASELLSPAAKLSAMKFFRRNNEIAVAAEVAETLYADDTTDSEINAVLAIASHANKDYGKALQHALRVLKSKPGDETMARIVKYAGARAFAG